MLCTDLDFEKRVVALYIFAWLVFATFPLSLSLIQAKGFLKILKHTPHWHKTKICKSVEKNFYLFFIQSLTDMTQMFNMIYRWQSFGGPQNTQGLRISLETSVIFSLVPGWSLLPRCPREVWEKAGERVSLGDVTSHEQRAPWAEAGLFSADPCLLLLLSALLLLVMSTLLLRAS